MPAAPPLPPADVDTLRELFGRLLGPDHVNALAPSPPHTTYTAWVTVWLLVYQRLLGNASLAQAVAHLQATLDPTEPDHHPSANTGGYNHARQRLPATLPDRLADRVFDALMAARPGLVAGRRVFAMDGTTLTLAPTPALRAAYPPASNRHGPSAWPILHLAVAHDTATGLAVRPEYGPKYGPEAVGEVELGVRLLDRLPPGSVVLGDRNFGIFRLAHAAVAAGHDTLIRLTGQRFRALVRSATAAGPGRWTLTWRPTPADRRGNPDLAADAAVRGWLYECRVPLGPGEELTLWLFTTVAGWDGPAACEVYKRRQEVETDLRSLKVTLALDRVSGRSADMVGKEVAIGVLAYNLVNQVRRVVAGRAGVSPRRLGFTGIWCVVRELLGQVARGMSWEDLGVLFDRLAKAYGRVRLPVRKAHRSYPREVIPRRRKFPDRKRKSEPQGM
jgi:hypothetical protein